SVSPISSIARRTSSLASGNGSQLWSATRYSRERPAVRRIAATPSGPTSFSTKGMRTFVKMQLTSPGIASARPVDELRDDVDRICQRVPHRRLAVDYLLALPHLVLGRRALDRDRVADVGHAIAHGLVVPQKTARIDVGLEVDVDRVDRHAEHLRARRNP